MTVEMNPVLPYSNAGNKKAWEYSEERTSPGDGAWVLFPQDAAHASITLEVDAGVGYIETSTALVEDIHAGTPIPVMWPHGAVTQTTQDSCEPITAFRMVNVSGRTKLVVRAQ